MTVRAPASRFHRPVLSLRRTSDVGLSFAMGAIVAVLMMLLPMQAALASSIVGAFVILALVDTRVAVLALLLVRSSMDVTATVPLLSASGSANVNAAAMMSFLAIGLAVAHVALAHLDVGRIPLARPMALFLAVSFAGVALAPDKAVAFQDWVRMVGSFAIYVLVVDLVETPAQQRWLVRILLASVLAPVAVGLWQYATNTGNTDTPGLVRMYGTFTHPSPYSFFLVQMVPLAAVFFVHTRSKFARLGLGVLLPAMVFCIFEAQTRGAWVGLVVSVMVFSFARARWTLIFIPLIAGAMYFGMSSVRARISDATSTTGSVLWRQQQWENALGVASTPQIATVGAGLGAVETDTGQPTHNEYLRLLVETGAIGLTIVLVLYVRLWRLARDAQRDASNSFERDVLLAFMMAFVGRAAIALSDNVIVHPALDWYFWAAAGLVIAMGGSYRRQRAGRRAPATDAPAA
jgi:O-antigen ligase